MSKIHLDNLAKKYPKMKWSGAKYEDLMSQIIAFNAEKVAKKSLQISEESFKKVLSKVKGEKRFILPNISDVLPKQSVFIRKGADSGKLLTDTLRDRLTGNLREALREFDRTGTPSMVMRRGEAAGRISPKLIREFKDRISETFEAYTKKNPQFGGVPANIKTIAVTEMRSTINDIKHQYVKQMVLHNPGTEVKKRWIHNAALVKQGRPGHVKLASKAPIDADAYFKVPVYRLEGGKMKFTRQYLNALHPHDPNLPAGEVIACSCDLDYIITEKKK